MCALASVLRPQNFGKLRPRNLGNLRCVGGAGGVRMGA